MKRVVTSLTAFAIALNTIGLAMSAAGYHSKVGYPDSIDDPLGNDSNVHFDALGLVIRKARRSSVDVGVD